MEQVTLQGPSNEATTLSRKAWTAYTNVVILWVFLLVAVAALTRFLGYYSIVVLLIGAGFLVYQMTWLQSIELYYDDNGVWLYRGVLPWKRGVIGIKWRDIELAAFQQNFSSWSTHSYTLQVLDRYTRMPELVLTDMLHGDRAVTFINRRLNEMIRNNSLVG